MWVHPSKKDGSKPEFVFVITILRKYYIVIVRDEIALLVLTIQVWVTFHATAG